MNHADRAIGEAVARATPWMTSEEAAGYLKVAVRVLHRYCRRGAVRFGRVGGQYRFTTEQLDAFVMVGGR